MVRSLAVRLALTLVLAACSASPATTAGPGPTTAGPGPTTTAGPSPATTDEAYTIAFGKTGLGVLDAPLLAALDALRAQGHTVTLVDLADQDLILAALAAGDIGLSTGNINSTAAAIHAGARIRTISDRIKNTWTMYGLAGIATCADLDGKRLAIHSEGSVSAAMARAWIAAECPNIEPNWLVIANSPNRMAALLADQIDATPLELPDANKLEQQDTENKFHLITDFGSSLPDLKVTTIQANVGYLAENRGAVHAFLRALIEEVRKVEADPEYLKEIIPRFTPDQYDPSTIDQVIASSGDIFDPNLELTPESVDYTLKFFVDSGSVDPGLTGGDVADLSILDEVLAEVGRR